MALLESIVLRFLQVLGRDVILLGKQEPLDLSIFQQLQVTFYVKLALASGLTS